MKKLFVLSVLVLAFVTASFAQRGTSTLGLQLGYNMESELTGLGVRFQYNMSDQWRIAPAFTYFFEHDDVSAYAFDVDLHYLFPLEHNLTIYPIVGMNFTNVDWDSDSDSGFGINAGIGIQCPISSNVVLSGEMKRSVLFDLHDQATIAFGVNYKF